MTASAARPVSHPQAPRSTRVNGSNRRTIAELSIAAMGSLAVVALYQIGALPHLPDPPGSLFDSERIVCSPEATALLSTPDALLGLGSYAATAVLAQIGDARRPRWLSIALGGKVAFDVYQASTRSVRQWRNHRALCSWCLVPAVATAAMVPCAIAELRRATP
ncbi:MAG TPA: vitamin K epoxide reductase family protein [Vicinamibacterales bacterium]|nr:vitamin K epoxide reductase family protein [Vicinamibacterales bacterium]